MEGSIPGSGRSPGGGNDNPLHYSCLENPMDRGIKILNHCVVHLNLIDYCKSATVQFFLKKAHRDSILLDIREMEM